MTDKLISILRFFLKEDFSQRRLFTVLLSALITILFFFFCHKQRWFVDLKGGYGTPAIVVVLSACFVVVFLVSELLCIRISVNKQKKVHQNEELDSRTKEAISIFDTLNRLTDWQKGFLIRNIMRRKSQIKGYEVGDYKLVWQDEMEALITKGIVTEISFDNYEINAPYYDYIEKHFDPNGKVLEAPTDF